MGLLKTVFEVNLGLFGGARSGSVQRCTPRGEAQLIKIVSFRSKQKTLLLFVIRDHVGSTPMSNLTSTLTQDMEKIWHSLSKVRLSLLL